MERSTTCGLTGCAKTVSRSLLFVYPLPWISVSCRQHAQRSQSDVVDRNNSLQKLLLSFVAYIRLGRRLLLLSVLDDNPLLVGGSMRCISGSAEL